ncbi:MAG: tetratricopeptide repeat protein [bacterium]
MKHSALVLFALTVCAATASLHAQCSPAVQRMVGERNFTAARAQADAQLSRAPMDDAAMHCIGRILLEKDSSAGSVEWMEKATAINEHSAQHHLGLGLALRAEGQKAGMLRAASFVRRVKTELDRSVALDPTLVEARYALVQFHLQAPGMMGGSVAAARDHATELTKTNAMRGRMATGLIEEHANDFVSAERAFLAAITTKPDSDAAYSAAGAFYRRRERWRDAIAMYERQIKVLSQDAPRVRVSLAHHFLAVALDKNGDRARATAEYRIALLVNPDNKDAKMALAGMEE